MIEIIGTPLNQWDTGRSVQVADITADHVHFANKGDSKAVIMELADSQAKIPDYLLQTGKQVCVYAVKNGVTVDSKIFYVKTRERPENYVYEDDQRNYIYELISKAETTIEGAHTAYENATNAVSAANTAIANANQATKTANESANSATLAAKNANEAADKANHTAKSLMVVGSAEGDSIYLDDAIDQFVVGLRVFGKTTQDGVPTPDAPVDLVSVEDPTVTVNDQTLLVPYTLHGIPVSSGGNYTDGNGQQWICDEIDLARGVYIKRTLKKAFDGSEVWSQSGNKEYFSVAYSYLGNTAGGNSCCSHFVYDMFKNTASFVSGTVGFAFFYSLDSVSDWKAFLADQFNNGSPVTITFPLTTPIETPLPEEYLATFAALRTSRGSTSVSNDASAHMEIEYVMDAKKYIDSLIGTTASAARVVYVNLPASKWTGSGSLYSQVVSIAGVTENSQVNLAPSVEQMATFYEKDITFVTENDGGVVTVYVIGQKPQNDYTIQADIVEVSE